MKNKKYDITTINILKVINKLSKTESDLTLDKLLLVFNDPVRIEFSQQLKKLANQGLLDIHSCIGPTVIGKALVNAYTLSIDGKDYLHKHYINKIAFYSTVIAAIASSISLIITIIDLLI